MFERLFEVDLNLGDAGADDLLFKHLLEMVWRGIVERLVPGDIEIRPVDRI